LASDDRWDFFRGQSFWNILIAISRDMIGTFVKDHSDNKKEDKAHPDFRCLETQIERVYPWGWI
jgi:hypothetical protein